MAKTISTKGKSFNEIAHLVKKIPATKKFNGKSYQRFTSSFSEWAINTEIKRLKAAKGTLGSRTMARKEYIGVPGGMFTRHIIVMSDKAR